MKGQKYSEYENNGGLCSRIDESDLMLDLKVLMKEYYIGAFENDGSAMKITLNNGQRFEITCREIGR